MTRGLTKSKIYSPSCNFILHKLVWKKYKLYFFSFHSFNAKILSQTVWDCNKIHFFVNFFNIQVHYYFFYTIFFLNIFFYPNRSLVQGQETVIRHAVQSPEVSSYVRPPRVRDLSLRGPPSPRVSSSFCRTDADPSIGLPHRLYYLLLLISLIINL